MDRNESVLLTPDIRGPFKVWTPPDRSRRYVLGADTAGGKSTNDFSAACVVDAFSGGVCATWHGHVEPDHFANICMAIGLYYGGQDEQAYFVPEINNHGLVVLTEVQRMGYHNIYTRVTWDAIENRMRPTLGFQTSVKSRPILIGRGKVILRDGEVAIPDETILNEMSTYVNVVSPRGVQMREDHAEGSNDDLLFSWMLAQEGRYRLHEAGLAPPPVREKAPTEAATVGVSRGVTETWVWEAHKRAVAESHARAEALADGDEYEQTFEDGVESYL